MGYQNKDRYKEDLIRQLRYQIDQLYTYDIHQSYSPHPNSFPLRTRYTMHHHMMNMCQYHNLFIVHRYVDQQSLCASMAYQ